ncbi:hypothetical protein [Paracoccus jeotgali]|uniref:hypothetical protein n=1 Tax=Paracoccus jeotgali TaxID=2065379 RepID=UPI0028AB587F|nr:hypothetical protein [Paracoccus jeotgali]
MRDAGEAEPKRVGAVVLESDGLFSVVIGARPGQSGTMRNVDGIETSAGVDTEASA